MTNIETNLQELLSNYDFSLADNLIITEYNSSVIFTDGNKLIRLFPNSNYEIKIVETMILLNDMVILNLSKKITNFQEKNQLLLTISECIYDRTNSEVNNG